MTTGKTGNLRWYIVVLVAVATIINYIDRTALSVLWPEISEDLELDKQDLANITIAFTFAYAFGQSIFGKIFDWIGVRLGFVLSIVVWSAATMLHAFAIGVKSFAFFRLLLGASEAGNWPGATKANGEWFPIRERALAQGIFNSGAAIGGILGIPVVGFLFVWFESWQVTFIVIGALGFLWLVPWLIIYKSGPETHPWISEQERAYILTGQRDETTQEKAEYAPSTGEILRRKESWGVILASAFIDPIWWLFVVWLPLFLAETYGLSIKETAEIGWMPYLGAACGAWFGGLLAGNRIAAGWTVNKTRKAIITFGCVIMILALVALINTITSPPIVAVVIMAVILFGFQTAVGNIQTLPSDFYAGQSIGTLAGFAGTAAKLSVVAFTAVIPMITETSYVPAFIVGTALAVLTAVSVLTLCPQIKPLKPQTF